MGVFGMQQIFDYDDACRDSVTVYREEGGEVSRTYHPRAYMEFERTENVDRTGSEQASGFLLVVPGPEQAVRPGDKVLLGEGPEVPEDAMKWWRTFIPAKVDNLAVVRKVDVKRWNGKAVHTEAGG